MHISWLCRGVPTGLAGPAAIRLTLRWRRKQKLVILNAEPEKTLCFHREYHENPGRKGSDSSRWLCKRRRWMLLVPCHPAGRLLGHVTGDFLIFLSRFLNQSNRHTFALLHRWLKKWQKTSAAQLLLSFCNYSQRETRALSCSSCRQKTAGKSSKSVWLHKRLLALHAVPCIPTSTLQISSLVSLRPAGSRLIPAVSFLGLWCPHITGGGQCVAMCRDVRRPLQMCFLFCILLFSLIKLQR